MNFLFLWALNDVCNSLGPCVSWPPLPILWSKGPSSEFQLLVRPEETLGTSPKNKLSGPLSWNIWIHSWAPNIALPLRTFLGIVRKFQRQDWSGSTKVLALYVAHPGFQHPSWFPEHTWVPPDLASKQISQKEVAKGLQEERAKDRQFLFLA